MDGTGFEARVGLALAVWPAVKQFLLFCWMILRTGGGNLEPVTSAYLKPLVVAVADSFRQSLGPCLSF